MELEHSFGVVSVERQARLAVVVQQEVASRRHVAQADRLLPAHGRTWRSQ